jgi:hypothetical protein
MDPLKPQPTITVANIRTELGNRVLTELVRAGWVVEYAYPDSAIDKGIDFDAYTIARDGERLEFEWTNWDEWQIRGPRSRVQTVCGEFGIEADSG